MEFIDKLKINLKKELPGVNAQKNLAPTFKGQIFRNFKPGSQAKVSAVLIPIVNIGGIPHLLFTLRNSGLNSHSGQISFPGGRIEDGETPLDASLRETEEETGIPSEEIEILGKLTPLFVPPSNSLIFPFVGYLESKPELTVNPDEVEEAFYTPIDYFLDKANLNQEEWDLNGVKLDVPNWKIHDKTPLWGASAMMLSELLTIIEKI